MVQIAEAILDYGRRDLEQVRTIEDLLDRRRKTAAVEEYVARAVRDREYQLQAQNAIAELRIRQERKIGEWLAARPRARGGNPNLFQPGTGSPKSYRDLGIGRTEAHRYQAEATVPEEVFERHVQETKQARKELTSSGLLDLAKRLRQAEEKQTRRTPSTKGCTVGDLFGLARTGTKFGTVNIDPPWPYDNQTTRAATSNHYEAMTLAEITALPVGQLAADASHCHLWTTTSFLPAALALLAAWGFAYKGLLVWCKPQLGLGNYYRNAVELLLLGVRGRCPFLNNAEKNWLCVDRRAHSEKPAEVRAIIERVSPPPRLELFARRTAPGWLSWGDEISRGEFLSAK